MYLPPPCTAAWTCPFARSSHRTNRAAPSRRDPPSSLPPPRLLQRSLQQKPRVGWTSEPCRGGSCDCCSRNGRCRPISYMGLLPVKMSARSEEPRKRKCRQREEGGMQTTCPFWPQTGTKASSRSPSLHVNPSSHRLSSVQCCRKQGMCMILRSIVVWLRRMLESPELEKSRSSEAPATQRHPPHAWTQRGIHKARFARACREVDVKAIRLNT